jgi:hypothetical protein
MENCCFYVADKIYRRSQELRGERNPAEVIAYPIAWCTHRHSPLPEDIAKTVALVSHFLTCDGDSAKCSIPEEKRLDC